jgi:hypothetical protein
MPAFQPPRGLALRKIAGAGESDRPHPSRVGAARRERSLATKAAGEETGNGGQKAWRILCGLYRPCYSTRSCLASERQGTEERRGDGNRGAKPDRR